MHGSWHGGWCWERLRPLLEAEGHPVLTPDLPAHGSDRTPLWLATLRGYSATIQAAARSMEEPPIVVGHSMGGFASAQAVADAPQLFRGLVHLCAFAPLSGDRLLSLHRSDPGSHVGRSTRWGSRGIAVRPERATELFYADCDPRAAADAISRLRPDPYPPGLVRCRFPSSFSAVPQGYIECTQDRAISIGYQRAMAARARVETIASMEASHSPFLSAPAELAQHLIRYSEGLASAT